MMNGGETIRKAPSAEPTPQMAPAAQVKAAFPAGTSPLDRLSAQQLQFLRQIVPGALESERGFTIPACVTIAQAILESATSAGWGTSSLFRLANNPFGIKYEHFAALDPTVRPGGLSDPNRPQGDEIDPTRLQRTLSDHKEPYDEFDSETWEIINGKKIKIFARFQRFPNLTDAFLAHAQLFCSPRYHAAFAVRSDWRQFAERLGPKASPQDSTHCCYSTNPEYGATLINLVEDYHFDSPRVLTQLFAGTPPIPPSQTALSTIDSLEDFADRRVQPVCEPRKT